LVTSQAAFSFGANEGNRLLVRPQQKNKLVTRAMGRNVLVLSLDPLAGLFGVSLICRLLFEVSTGIALAFYITRHIKMPTFQVSARG
jgi:hypothetical protein